MTMDSKTAVQADNIHLTSPEDVEIAQVVRGGVVDCVHRGRIVVVDRDGKILYQAGDASSVAFLRSTAKPFQAAAIVESGAAKHFHFTAPELALSAGSHSGTTDHLEILHGMMYKVGVDADDLLCGVSAPLDASAHDQLLMSGGHASTLTHNCSGKHVAMLAACKTNNWDIKHYVDREHPLQTRILQLLALTCRIESRQIQLATDGCSVPTFGLPMVNIALGCARMGLSVHQDNALGQIAKAMQAHPLVFSGAGRYDAVLVQATQGRLIAKGGAEGLVGIGVPERGVGIAMKISDGSQRAMIPVLSSVLRQLDLISASEQTAIERAMPSAVLTNAGVQAGEIVSLL